METDWAYEVIPLENRFCILGKNIFPKFGVQELLEWNLLVTIPVISTVKFLMFLEI